MNQNHKVIAQNQFEHYYNYTQTQISSAIVNLTQQELCLIQKIKFLEHLRNKKIVEENQEIELLKQKISMLEQEQELQEEPEKKNIENEEKEKIIPEEKPFEEGEQIINQTIADLLGNQDNAYIALPNSLAEGKIVNFLDLYM